MWLHAAGPPGAPRWHRLRLHVRGTRHLPMRVPDVSSRRASLCGWGTMNRWQTAAPPGGGEDHVPVAPSGILVHAGRLAHGTGSVQVPSWP
jgi:hypothetical protein